MHTIINRYIHIPIGYQPSRVICIFIFAINHTFISMKISSKLTIPAKEFIRYKTLLAF